MDNSSNDNETELFNGFQVSLDYGSSEVILINNCCIVQVTTVRVLEKVSLTLNTISVTLLIITIVSYVAIK